MHYTGMAAMRGHAELSYAPLFVALSLALNNRRLAGAALDVLSSEPPSQTIRFYVRRIASLHRRSRVHRRRPGGRRSASTIFRLQL
jgi:NO-binding membrane sensor protein with MHYT domain